MLLDQLPGSMHRFADAQTAKQADLAALGGRDGEPGRFTFDAGFKTPWAGFQLR